MYRVEQRDMSRRRALGLMAGAGAGLLGGPLLAACGRGEGEAEDASEGDGDGGTVVIATTIATTEDEAFFDEWLGRFTEDTGIRVTPRFYPDPQYNESIQLLFQSGDQPDIFRMRVPGPSVMPTAHQRDWLQPLDEYDVITDLLGSEYPEGALDPSVSGLHMGDELYGVPSFVNKASSNTRALMVNAELMDQFNIAEPPQAWGDLKDVAAKITSDSNGEVFGFAILGQPITFNFYAFQHVAGPQMQGATPIDYQTGRAGASHPSMVDTVSLLHDMAADDIYPPGWQNMDSPAFFQAFAAGKIAMAIGGGWQPGEIRKINPEIEITLSEMPIPNAGRGGFGTTGGPTPGVFVPHWGMARDAPTPEGAATLMAFLGGSDVLRARYEATGIVPATAASFIDELDPLDRRMLELAEDLQRNAPNPLVRDVDSHGVLAAIQNNAPTPTLDEIVFAAIDEGADYETAAAAFDQKLDEAIDDEIAKAQAEGLGVTRDTFTFPDWDPLEDYVTQPGS